ncbi:hypothetical protein [Noviherbaspirillum agri]
MNTSLQLTLMMVTVFKLGGDAIILSQCLKPEVGYNYRLHFRKIAIIVAAGFFVIVYLNGLVFGSILLVAASVDTYSVLKISELNAKQKPIVASFSSLFYVPISCIFLFLMGGRQEMVPFVILMGSVGRLSYLLIVQAFFHHGAKVTFFIDVPPLSMMLIQQTLNFVIFRSDQILIGMLYKSGRVTEFVGGGLVWAKAVEFYTAATLLIAAVVYPTLVTGRSLALKRAKAIFKTNVLYVYACACLMIFVFALMAGFVIKNYLDYRFLPFFLQACLVVPANLMTYILFKANKIDITIKSALTAIIFSAAFLVAALMLDIEFMMLFLGFVQLAIYLLSGVIFSGGENIVSKRCAK